MNGWADWTEGRILMIPWMAGKDACLCLCVHIWNHPDMYTNVLLM
jgi:hypothetical protein